MPNRIHWLFGPFAFAFRQFSYSGFCRDRVVQKRSNNCLWPRLMPWSVVYIDMSVERILFGASFCTYWTNPIYGGMSSCQ
jgi:hypothetical protein